MEHPDLYLVVSRAEPDTNDPTRDRAGWRAASAVSPDRAATDRHRAMLALRDTHSTATYRLARVTID